MNREYLLSHIGNEKQFFQRELVEGLFVGQKRVNSFMSAMLEKGGHRPETEACFDEELLRAWCDKNNVKYYFEELDLTYCFVKKK